MKKVGAILMICFLLVSLVGCGKTSDKVDTGKKETETGESVPEGMEQVTFENKINHVEYGYLRPDYGDWEEEEQTGYGPKYFSGSFYVFEHGEVEVTAKMIICNQATAEASYGDGEEDEITKKDYGWVQVKRWDGVMWAEVVMEGCYDGCAVIHFNISDDSVEEGTSDTMEEICEAVASKPYFKVLEGEADGKVHDVTGNIICDPTVDVNGKPVELIQGFNGGGGIGLSISYFYETDDPTYSIYGRLTGAVSQEEWDSYADDPELEPFEFMGYPAYRYFGAEGSYGYYNIHFDMDGIYYGCVAGAQLTDDSDPFATDELLNTPDNPYLTESLAVMTAIYEQATITPITE